MVEPNVMVWYCHRLKSDTLGIFEERVRPPDLREPLHGEEPVLRGHVVWQDQSGANITVRHTFTYILHF